METTDIILESGKTVMVYYTIDRKSYGDGIITPDFGEELYIDHVAFVNEDGSESPMDKHTLVLLGVMDEIFDHLNR